MLTSLFIQNFALIESLHVHPSPNLNVVTGETGAGKSIILGAINLLLGQRMIAKEMLNPQKKCIIEGVFLLENDNLESYFLLNQLDFDKTCTLRREVNAQGKSRAFVNDTPVNLTNLKDIGIQLVDIHSQHESLDLKKQQYQLDILDTFTHSHSHLKNYQEQYKDYLNNKKYCEELEKKASKENADLDYKTFILEELSQTPLEEIDIDALENEIKELENAETLKSKLIEILSYLDGNEMSSLDLMQNAKYLLQQLSSQNEDLEKMLNTLENIKLELQDLTAELKGKEENTLFQPEKIEELKKQLDSINRLLHKHQVKTTQELLNLKDQLTLEIDEIQNIEEKIKQAQAQLEKSEKSLREKGEIVREKRLLAAQDLSHKIEQLIKKIGIENGKIAIEVTPCAPTPSGMDTITFKFSANKGIPPKDMSQVASGGEYSRLLFSIKYLLAEKKRMPTLIFDEIDTGVSGEIALKMAQMMLEMSQKHQIISISHLPQFAAKGNKHFLVYKNHETEFSTSRIKELSEEERIKEIAIMIGGYNPSPSAYQSAKELMRIS